MSAALAMTTFVGIVAGSLVTGPAALAATAPAAPEITDTATAAPEDAATTTPVEDADPADADEAATTTPEPAKTPAPESESPAAADTPAPTETPAATAKPTTKPAPAESPTKPQPTAETKAAAPAATVGLAVEVSKDGNGSFSKTDEPGGDTSDINGIVRTLDAITYRVTVSSNGGTSDNERFTLTAPTGTSWASSTGTSVSL
ncbi:MAG: hypothetical protein V4755_13015, partial [Curtobacterium sp.]